MIFFEEEFDLLEAFIGEGQDPVVIIGAAAPAPTWSASVDRLSGTPPRA
ncbi:hypothetical protein [Mesorhizobium sp.]|nr:hypothetical protein [Mesorhizobium sp.]